MPDWSAQQYLKFEDQRSRPARDLAAQIPLSDPRRIVDLGCGPGNSTEILRARYPNAEIVGLDSSPDMLAKARARLPGVSFVEGNLETWPPPAGVDLLYSNATFQWVPDHLAVLERLLAALPEGGVLAVQMPDNGDEPSHALLRKIAAHEPWVGLLASANIIRDGLPPVSTYYDRLRPRCRAFDIWHTLYEHPIDDADGIVEWFKGSRLRPYLDALGKDRAPEFLAAYTAEIARAYPPQFDGKRLLRFPRLFIVAVR
jgi:trans-aconitate 2-methyltransferase